MKRLFLALLGLLMLGLQAHAQVPGGGGITIVTDTSANTVNGPYKLLINGGTVSNPSSGVAEITISGGGTGCTPAGGQTTNIVLYGAGGLCTPALDANITNGDLSLGLVNSVGGTLDLFGSSSAKATITGGTNGTFTSASPWALSGVFTLTGASNALGTPLTLVGTNITGTAAGLTAGAVALTGITGMNATVQTDAANTPNAASGLLTYAIIGTSGATLGLLNANKTDSGNNTWSGGTLTMSGLTSGAVAANSYIGLDASNHLVLGAGGGGGGSLTITDGTHSQTAVTTASLGSGLVTTNGSSGTGPINLAAPVRTVTSSTAIGAGDLNGQIIMNVSGGGTLTVPATSTFVANATVSVVNYSASTAAVSTTPTINAGGGCVTATGIPSGDTWQMLSNGTTIDCFQTVSSIGGSGTVTSASVASANGFAGTVATATTTPAITISTSVTGITKGNGTALSAATAGTDYVAPGGALGTPSSGTATNLTGTAAGLTAGTASAAPVSGLTGAGANVVTALGTTLSAAGGLSSTIASGTSALGTGAITSATCATVVTTTATNTATTDVIWWGFNGDPTGVTGYIPATAGMLTIIAYPTANNTNFKVCNNTSSSITPGAITLNWRVIR